MDVAAHTRQNLAYDASLAKFLRRRCHFNPLLQVSLAHATQIDTTLACRILDAQNKYR